MTRKKEKLPFTEGQHVVYPIHGPGVYKGLTKKQIGDEEIELMEFVFNDTSFFVPCASYEEFGIRKLETPEMIKKALGVLSSSQGHSSHGNLSKKMAECSARINSGRIVDLCIAIAETAPSNPNSQVSITQKNIHTDAIDKLALEISLVLNCSIIEANKMIYDALWQDVKAKDTIEDDFSEDEFSEEETHESKMKKSIKKDNGHGQTSADSEDFDDDGEEDLAPTKSSKAKQAA